VTRPVWRPHQVRDQVNTITQQGRIYTNFRNLTPAPATGPGQGLPTFAGLTWHWPTSAGAITAVVSDRKSLRWACNVVAAVIDVTTFSTNFTIEVFKNGTLVPGLTCAITGAGVGQRFICNPTPVVPYSDYFTVEPTSPGTGNEGIIVTLECV
jgi:hypothetical protein